MSESTQPRYGTGVGSEKKPTSKWKLGCAIGCGGILLIIIILAGMGYYLIKDTITAFDETAKTTKLLREKLGKEKSFCPAPDGVIPADRLEIFLAVRESAASQVKQMEQEVTGLIENINRRENKEESAPGVYTIVKGIFGALPHLADYFTHRNRQLLEQGMGLGEYYYIYTIVYYSWLKRTPGDGPDFSVMNRGENRTIRFVIGDMLKDKKEKEESGEEESWQLEDHGHEGRARMRSFMLHVMGCQLEKLSPGAPGEETVSWKETLTAEIAALKKDRKRVPWQDGLPGHMTVAMEPLRRRLEKAYYRLLNPIEFGMDGG